MEEEMSAQVYYPLAPGNTWTYRQSDGNTFTNTVTSADPSVPGRFTMVNSVLNKDQFIRKEGAAYQTDSFETGNFQVLLRDDLNAGDTWDIMFKANGLDSVLAMKVKEKGISMEIEGKTFENLLVLEGESKILMSGNLMSINFFTQYYYAPGVGLVLTTTNSKDSMSLVSWKLDG
jgi:hypothetical protein